MDAYGNRYTYYPSDNSRVFNNPKFIGCIVGDLERKLKRPLINTEKMSVVNYFKKIDAKTFEGASLEDLRIKIGKFLLSQMNAPREQSIDLHEMLKQQLDVADNTVVDSSGSSSSTAPAESTVDVKSVMGVSSLTDIMRMLSSPTNPSKYAYLNFDTRYRNLSTDGTTSFQWNFVNNEIVGQGSVNFMSDIRNIIAMRIQSVRIPYTSSADNNYRRITMFINEFSAQSYIAHENVRYHFVFKPEVDGNYIELETRTFNDGYFRFQNPISNLTTFTFSFGSPLSPIVFDSDRSTATIVSYGRNTVFSILSPNNLTSGDTVYLTGFSTTNNNVDVNAVSGINSSTGNDITTVLSTTQFSLSVDTSSVSGVGVGTIAVTNGSPTVTGTGTYFNEVFAVSDTINILGTTYTISTISSDTSLTLTANYTGTTAPSVSYSMNTPGSVSVTNGSTAVTGTSTTFTTTFNINDTINIAGVGYTVAAIASNTSMTLSTSYAGTTNASAVYAKNNNVSGQTMAIYFGSKRIFINIEFECL